ncbi:spore gernimation protein GerC [Thermaerobacter sp. PB12/4term]|nr:spore gernimation protein GerC [Thermaerobacter sp. PB12/4term]
MMMSRGGRWRAGFVLILSALTLGGCWGYNEVNDLAFITVAALDRNPAGRYLWTVAIPVPELVLPASVGGGGAGGPGMSRNTLFRSAPGQTPRMAAESLDRSVPREVRWSFTDHILIGEPAARSGLRPLLEMISRSYRVERKASLYVVRGEAGSLLELLQPALDRSLARSFDALGRKNRPGTIRVVDGNTVLRWLDTPGIDPFLPVVATGRTRDTINPVPAGLALFARDRLVGFLPPPLDEGLLMARGEAHPFTLAVPCPEAAGEGGGSQGTAGPETSGQATDGQGSASGSAGGETQGGAGGEAQDVPVQPVVSLRIDRNEARIQVVETGPPPRVAVEVKLEGTLLEWQCPGGRVDRTRAMAVRRAVARQAQRQIRAALEQAAALGADPAGFGTALYRQDPAAWRALQAGWRRELRQLRPAVRVKFHLRSYDLTVSAP